MCAATMFLIVSNIASNVASTVFLTLLRFWSVLSDDIGVAGDSYVAIDAPNLPINFFFIAQPNCDLVFLHSVPPKR
jgi:hypothetical protein